MNAIRFINDFIWAFPMVILLIFLHIYLTFKTKFIQKHLLKGIHLSLQSGSFKVLATTLAATLGTGNIIGMSTAIYMGGPGAILWCWITGILGMATCYYECFIGMFYRDVKNRRGGPMYALKHGLKMPVMAVLFCIFTVFACFGVGCTSQSNALSTSIHETFDIPILCIAFATALICGFIINGGLTAISSFCTYLVPVMTVIFTSCCLLILFRCHEFILPAIKLILSDAFSGKAVFGGCSGGLICVLNCARYGIARGLFTNEAGLGSTAIAAGSSELGINVSDNNRHNVCHEQGLISMTSVFWDTVVMCALTGLVIVSCMLKNPLAFKNATSGSLMNCSFNILGNVGGILLTLCIALFAFATLNGWCFFGESAITFLACELSNGFHLNQKIILDIFLKIYRLIYMVMIFLGAIMQLDSVWELCDFFNALMFVPNFVCIMKTVSSYKTYE